MKIFLSLVILMTSTLSQAGGLYSDENIVICDVDLKLWPEVKARGYLEVQPESRDPFIHCARPSQLHAVMNKYFKGTTQVILVTHSAKIPSILKYENSYPHLYGRLELKDVITTITKAPDSKGYYSLPDEFAANEAKLNCELIKTDSCVGDVRWNCFEAYVVKCSVSTKRAYSRTDAEALKEQLGAQTIKY